MNYLPISDNAARQVIDATIIWAEYLKARTAARPYAGGMYWKKEGAYEYLVKTGAKNKQVRMGVRSIQSETIYNEFHKNKAAKESRLASLTAALVETQRQNKALKTGRTPERLVWRITSSLLAPMHCMPTKRQQGCASHPAPWLPKT
jgi:hypothetical protein